MRVTIEKMVYGGAGLARSERGVLFVPRTAPGDVVEVEIVASKSDYANARVVELLEPSEDRQIPACPNYETAGCCHWQHIRYGRQLEIKEQILRETLQRTGRLPWEGPIEIVSGPENGYRLRASFHTRDRKVGFVREGSNEVVPISECAALSPELNAFIPEANRVLEQPSMDGVSEVHAISGPPVVAMFGKKRTGNDVARIDVGGLTFDLAPDAFFQSNRHLLERFMDGVARVVTDRPNVLDLYCGCGFFSLALAGKSRQVLGVEWSRAAIRQARLNAELNKTKNVEFFEGDVEATVRKSADLKPDLVVVNPPRAGCGRQTISLIAKLGAKNLVYVSCNPATFAREIPALSSEGYHLERLMLIDQFPNTYHIELVAEFRK
jgi:23S rRNA (uracil1939-C5)-methyltransferase